MKKRANFFGIIVVCFTMLSSISNVFAAGYDVLMEPNIAYIDGINRGSFDAYTTFEEETYFYPTPFYKGVSVVHNNIGIMPDYRPIYFAKSSYVVDAYGNQVNVGEYDSFGGYPRDFNKNPSSYEMFKEYFHPPFNPYVGVNQQGYIIVVKNGKGGLIDTQGNVIIPCEYDDLYDEAYDLYGIIYHTIIDSEEYQGKYFETYHETYHYDAEGVCYYNGLAVVSEKYEINAKVGIVDKNDNIIVPFIYDMITPCYDGICWVLKDGKWGIISVDNQTVTVKVDDEEVVFDQIPLIIKGRTLAPLRAIFEKLGATVEWNGETQTITSTKGDTVITMNIDKNEMYKNDEMIRLDVAPQIIGDRTLVPVRAIAEAFDCNVVWDSENYIVNIANEK